LERHLSYDVMSFPELDILLDKKDFVVHLEAKRQDNPPLPRNLITGIKSPAREAVEKTIATLQTFALDYTRPAIAEYCVPSVGPAFGGEQSYALVSPESMMHAAVGRLVFACAAELPEEGLAQTAGAVAQASRINFEMLGAVTGSAALAGLDFSNFEPEGHIEAIQRSYSGRLASVIRDILYNREITQETIKPLEALIETKVASLPQNRVSAEGMLTLFTTLLPVVISHETHREYFVNGSLVAGHLNPLIYIIGGVLENTKRLIPDIDDNTYYRVMRQVGVSARPKSRTSQTGLLVPAQTVRLVDRSHKWIAVEYFDQIHGIARQGWAPKKYFQQMSAVAAQPAREAPSQITGNLSVHEQKEITDNWEETNQRRIDLIYKQADNNLTSEEEIELERLQRLTDERIRLVAPLPLSSLESVLKNLERST
jgi:hypothetical protein